MQLHESVYVVCTSILKASSIENNDKEYSNQLLEIVLESIHQLLFHFSNEPLF